MTEHHDDCGGSGERELVHSRAFPTTTEEMEVRPGGRWKYVMRGPDGRDHPNLIVYEAEEGRTQTLERLAAHLGGAG